MIDQVTVDKVLETANSQIVEVVSDYVTLRRRGINYLGNCPFHNEKTPSFTVSPHKGIFKCFGCGEGGNALNFVMKHDQLSFVDAIKYLGKKFNIEIEEEEYSPEQLKQKNERESMMVLSEYAGHFFSKNLNETDEGKSVGLGYFRSRGFRDDIIEKFQLGYSPEQRDALTQEALRQGYKLEYLEKTGLTVVRDNYQADRFRGRVMFPIHSLAGKVIAFGGRILKNDKKTAKYLNSPESEIYHKSRVLYGIYHAKQEITRQDRCYLVEGYTDVLAFHQSGISNVVASSGTALTSDQIRLIARFTKNITIIYDGDPAGLKASLRGIDLVLAEGMNVKILLLPDGEDPDSFAKERNDEQLTQYIEQHQQDFIKFKTSLLLEEAQNDPIKKAQLIQDIVRSISIIPDSITRSVYVKECSTLLKVDERVLMQETGKLQRKKQEEDFRRNAPRNDSSMQSRPAETAPAPEKRTPSNPLELEEREILRFLVKFGERPVNPDEDEKVTVGQYILHELRQDDLLSVNPIYNKMMDAYEAVSDKTDMPALKFFVNSADPDLSRLASDLVGKEHDLSKIHHKFGIVTNAEELLPNLVPKIVMELKWKKVKTVIKEKRQQLQQMEVNGNMEGLMELMQELNTWQQVLAHISKELGGRTIV
ncbi:DNA primase [Carboxylicivirga sediminis]|uniref:DNA primase n=1 Tax=Carboxylicivirga sediminis TaxID=2006564 RepID=A0A941F5X0_9BACT|nr:DNA primase [Carboxylicivirga sediminis]MBR8537067.1 DNA primase [Carboxylicivirga sediminis]